MTMDFTLVNRPRSFSVSVGDGVIARLLSFTNLAEGWDYGRGKQIGFDVIIQALGAAVSFREMGARAVEAFPRNNGGVMVSAYQEDLTLELNLEPSCLASLIVENGDEEVASFDGKTVAELIAKVGEARWLEKSTFDLSTQEITLAWTSNVFNQQLSKIQMTEYLSSFNNVWMTAAMPSVITYEDTTQRTFPAIRQYSGDSRKKYFLMDAA